MFVVDLDADRDLALSRARALAERSTHVFSQAVARFAETVNSDSVETWEMVKTVPGRGVYACGGCEWEPSVLGNRRLIEDLQLEIPNSLEAVLEQGEQSGEPVSLVGWGGRVRAVFVFREELRSDAADVLAACCELGLDVGILTGDHPGRGRRIGQELNVPVKAALLPDDKVEEIRRAQETFGSVIMVGDGLNDAVACAEADVGIALGCGADVTRESASVCLISNELGQIPWLLDLSRRTMRTVKSNLRWTFGYNAIGVVAAAAGWLHPALAAALMVASSLYVISNSLRLGRDHLREGEAPAEPRAIERVVWKCGSAYPEGAHSPSQR